MMPRQPWPWRNLLPLWSPCCHIPPGEFFPLRCSVALPLPLKILPAHVVRDDFADWCRTNTEHYYGIDCLRLADGIKEIVNLSGYEKTCVGDNIRKVVLMHPVAEEDEPQLLAELESCGPGVTQPDIP